MERQNCMVDITDDETHNQRKSSCDDLNDSCDAAIYEILPKRKANCMVEDNSGTSWKKKKRISFSSSNHGESMSFRGPTHSSSPQTFICNCHVDKDQLPPLHLMLNTDFIVTSHLKQDLMLAMALTHKKRYLEKLILVSHFRAFLSFGNFGLGPEALRVWAEPNAGGTSTISEALSVEYFVRRFKAKEIVTEMEVDYCLHNWKKVDYICTLYGQRIGVSVTRAMSYPDPHRFSPEKARKLLHKKLFGLIVARDGMADRHCFSQCILHVWCETEKTAKLLEAEYAEVFQELEVTDNVIMMLTIADGLKEKPIFYEYCLN